MLARQPHAPAAAPASWACSSYSQRCASCHSDQHGGGRGSAPIVPLRLGARRRRRMLAQEGADGAQRAPRLTAPAEEAQVRARHRDVRGRCEPRGGGRAAPLEGLGGASELFEAAMGPMARRRLSLIHI